MTLEIGGLYVILLLIVPFLAADAIAGSLMQRAVLYVVQIFWEHKAIGVKKAKTLEELGFVLPDGKSLLLSPREFRALQRLMQGGIIRTEEKNRLYLPEEKFANFRRFLDA